MNCPACKEALVVVEHAGIEVDYCTGCHGVWFDSGELELLLESMNIGQSGSTDNIIVLNEKKVSEKARHCPICNKNMKKVVIGTNHEVLIDACPQEHGLWFDGGELGQVVHQLIEKHATDSTKEARVISFLGNVFKVGI